MSDVLAAAEKTASPRRRSLLIVAIASGGAALTCLIDRDVYHLMRLDRWESELATRDWAQMLRSAGYLPTWIIAGLIIELGSRRRDLSTLATEGPRRLGWRLMLGAAMGGLLAEIVKQIVRRHRPSLANDGQHVYDWFAGHVEGRGLGLASSHAGVAFGAAFILWRWSPRAGLGAMALAIACSTTRLLAGAHFLSDVVAAALLAWLGAEAVTRLFERSSSRPTAESL